MVSRYQNPKEFRIKQDMLRQIKGQEIIFKLLKEGTVIFEILEDITSNRELYASIYRLDVYDTSCQIFYYCHLILVLFCEGNLENQAILIEVLPLFLTNTNINFGQIDLLRRICKREPESTGKNDPSSRVSIQKSKVLTQYADSILRFLFDLIVKHGKIAEVVYFLIDLVHTNDQAIRE